MAAAPCSHRHSLGIVPQAQYKQLILLPVQSPVAALGITGIVPTSLLLGLCFSGQPGGVDTSSCRKHLEGMLTRDQQ